MNGTFISYHFIIDITYDASPYIILNLCFLTSRYLIVLDCVNIEAWMSEPKYLELVVNFYLVYILM